MEIGIGLPSTVLGMKREELLEWSRKAESAGFSTLGALDRIVYPGYDPLIALTAAAAVTERIRLTTGILIVPFRASAAIVAKQTASLHAFSGGRLELGVAIGAREDDYTVAGVPHHERGRRFDKMLQEMNEVWSGEVTGHAGPVGPQVNGGPPLLIGGYADKTFERAARHATGWIAGGLPPDAFAESKAKLEAAWERAGREGKPKASALAYFGLGDGAGPTREYLLHYYDWLGDQAKVIADSAAYDADTVRAYVQGFEDAGCDELIWFPGHADPEQVDLLAEAALARTAAG
jgi:alkanesulfonate monooxygenase SsuD/methylene tetrahydromethanopterin reductase-like flavin-dependent oxidoreductase (luciferase family)